MLGDDLAMVEPASKELEDRRSRVEGDEQQREKSYKQVVDGYERIVTRKKELDLRINKVLEGFPMSAVLPKIS
jgi:hypothetical protein